MKLQHIAIGGILINDGKALVIRRGKNEYTSVGYWEFPKGAAEWGEGPTTALKREFLEEVNLNIELDSIHNIYNHTYTNHEGDEIHFWEIEYKVHLSEGEDLKNIRLSDDHDKWKFIGPEEAETIQKMYADKRDSLLRALADKL